MAESLGSAVLTLEADGSSLFKGLDGAKDKLSTFGSMASSVGQSLSLAVTAPIVGMGTAALMAAGNFEAGMNAVRAVTRASDEDFARLTESAKELGSTTKFSASEAAAGMEFLGMAGFQTNQIIEAMPGLLALASAGSIELGDAADIASNVLSGFGLEAADAGRVADVLALAAASSNTSVSQLGQAMSFVAPLARAAGMSLEETAAQIGVLGDSGIQATRAGTGLRGVIGDLLKPSTEAGKALMEMGFNLEELAAKTPIEQMQALGQANLGAAESLEIFGRQGGASALIMAEGSDRAAELTEQLKNAGGAADEMAKIKSEGLNGALVTLKSSLETLAITIANTGLMEFVQGLVERVTDLVRWVAQLPTPVLQAGVVLAGLAAAIGPVLLIAGKLATSVVALGGAWTTLSTTVIPAVTKAVGLLTGGFGGLTTIWASVTSALPALGTAFAALTGPIGLTVAAVVAVGAAIVAFIATNDDARSKVGEIWDSIKAHAEAVWNGVKEMVSATAEAILGVLAFFGVDVQRLLELASDPIGAFGEAWDWVKDVVYSAVETVGGWIKGFVDGVRGWMGEAAGHLSFLGEAFAALREFVRPVTDWIAKQFGEIVAAAGKVREAASSMFNLFRTQGQAELKKFAEASESTAKAVDEIAAAADNAESSAKTAANSLDQTAGSTDAMATAARSATPALQSAGKAAKEDLAKGADDARFSLEQFNREAAKTQAEMDKIAKQSAVELAQSIESLGPPMIEIGESMAQIGDDVRGLLVETIQPEFDSMVASAGATANEVAQAFRELGLKTRPELEALAKEAESRFETIRLSGVASTEALDKAWIDMLKKRREALVANGQELTREDQETLSRLLGQQQDFRNASTGPQGAWSGWVGDMQKSVADLSQNMVSSLLDDPAAFGKRFLSSMSSLGKSVKDDLIGAADQAVQGLVNQGLSALTGSVTGLIGKMTGPGGLASAFSTVFGADHSIQGMVSQGLAALSGSIARLIGQLTGPDGLASAFTRVFGAGGGAGSSAAGSGAEGAAGGGGGGGGGASDPISGWITAISNVISNLQLATSNKALKLIELEVRQLKNLIRDDVLKDLWFKSNEMQFGTHVKVSEMARNTLWEIRDLLRGGIAVAAIAGAVTIGEMPAQVIDPAPTETTNAILEQVSENTAQVPPLTSQANTILEESVDIVSTLPPLASRTNAILEESADVVSMLPPLSSRTNAILEDATESIDLLPPLSSRTNAILEDVADTTAAAPPLLSRTNAILEQISSSAAASGTTFGSMSVADRQAFLDAAAAAGRTAEIFGPGVDASAGSGFSHTADLTDFMEEIGFQIPQYAQGTPYVPQTGLALLHRGERVLTAEENRAGAGGITVVIEGGLFADDSSINRVAAALSRAVETGGVELIASGSMA